MPLERKKERKWKKGGRLRNMMEDKKPGRKKERENDRRKQRLKERKRVMEEKYRVNKREAGMKKGKLCMTFVKNIGR